MFTTSYAMKFGWALIISHTHNTRFHFGKSFNAYLHHSLEESCNYKLTIHQAIHSQFSLSFIADCFEYIFLFQF